ncbi:MAG TPA: gephyrin-like molybdotransferase Glp [Bdellovibrionota bacterium]|nr:gephyrin-like molybdotransferase Glp [Bdellovibrionota bacterium]
MIGYGEALEEILRLAERNAPSRSIEECPLEEAIGRVLQEELRSAENVPGFANSAMDGFAVLAEETASASYAKPVRLRVAGSIAAGEAPRASVVPERKTCWEIMTGAAVPAAFDSVVKIENVEVKKNIQDQPEEILLFSPVERGAHVRQPGEDFEKGSRVASSGTLILPRHVVVLASLGIAKLKVARRARVAVISTGSELSGISEALQPGKIRNSTGPFLRSALFEIGSEVTLSAEIQDNPGEFRGLLEGILRTGNAEVVITTGAVSMGRHDFIAETLRTMGATIRFHKVAIRPGKPVLVAEFQNRERPLVVFGLPGNPVSTAVGMRFFVEPYLRALLQREEERAECAILTADVPKPEGLRCFFKARVVTDASGNSTATVLPGQASFMVSPLLEANAWTVLPEQGTQVRKGTLVQIFPMEGPR